jgi:hypothetical protein
MKHEIDELCDLDVVDGDLGLEIGNVPIAVEVGGQALPALSR